MDAIIGITICVIATVLASSPGRFLFFSLIMRKGEKNGLVFIAWVIVRMRYIIGIFHRKLYRKFINKIY